jgi:ribosomal-protein-alanine N-acetyltransferase
MKRHMFFPEIETIRLKLRAFTPEDLQFVFDHFSNPDVCQYLYDCEPFTSLDEAKKLMTFYEEPEKKDHNRWSQYYDHFCFSLLKREWDIYT